MEFQIYSNTKWKVTARQVHGSVFDSQLTVVLQLLFTAGGGGEIVISVVVSFVTENASQHMCLTHCELIGYNFKRLVQALYFHHNIRIIQGDNLKCINNFRDLLYSVVQYLKMQKAEIWCVDRVLKILKCTFFTFVFSTIFTKLKITVNSDK